MDNIPDKYIDMILCDLPYGTTACEWDIIIPFNEMWKQYKRIIRDGGYIVLTSSQPFTSELIISNIKWFSHEIIWVKEQGTNFLLSNVQPLKIHENIIVFSKPVQESKNDINKYFELRKYFKYIFDKIGKSKKEIIQDIGHGVDHCFRFNSSQWSLPTKDNYYRIENTYNINLKPYEELVNIYERYNDDYKLYKTYNPQFTFGNRTYISGNGTSGDVTGNVKKIQTKNNGKRYPKSIIKFNRETGLHPTQKPVGLCEYLIKTYTNNNEIVLDNCMGSGTTGIAALNTNRKFIGIELKRKYFDIAQKRIEKQINQAFNGGGSNVF